MLALGATWFQNQERDMEEMALIDAHNRFNKLIRLAMLRTVRHLWLTGAIFTSNLYNHWAQLLLRHTGSPSVTLLSREEERPGAAAVACLDAAASGTPPPKWTIT